MSDSDSSDTPLPQLNDVLRDLKTVVNEIKTNADYRRIMATQLNKKHGYSLERNSSPENVIKVIAIEVNYIFQKRVVLSGIRNDHEGVQKSLRQLLTRDNQLREYFDSNEAYTNVLQEAKSPLDLARKLKKTVPQWLVNNIIQHQFNIKWSTRTGQPDNYTFYQFYEMKNTSSLLKYAPRQAHVKATLYKECRSICNDVQRKSKEELCPMVYIRTVEGWKTWRAGEVNFKSVTNIDHHLKWIHGDIRKFIKENADQQKDDCENCESLKKSLKKPTLYWAVLQDNDLLHPENLELNEFSKTQVYVGKAINGIRGRWTRDSDNHCSMMKKCLDNVCAMTTYDPLRLEGIQLVDARLALAKVRNENTALFVIKTFGDEFEKAKMRLLACLEVIRETLSELLPEPSSELLEYEREIFPDVVTIFSDDAETLSNEAEEMLSIIEEYLKMVDELCLDETSSEEEDLEEKLEEKLDEAITCVEDLRNADSKKDRSKKAKDSLEEAEKQHRIGKRIMNKRLNIIPPTALKPRWEPKDMKYGMNKS